MPNLKDSLKGRLNKRESALLIKSFDIIGDLAIIQIPKGISRHEKKIAKAVLSNNKNIKGVFKKSDAHKGVFRTQKLKFLSGEKRKTTVHKESGVSISLDIEKCYFSPRLSSERLRIARLIKPEEKVLVMFSGAGPYPLVIAKHSRAKEVYGIELNKIAHDFSQKNIINNKLQGRIKLFNGDARRVIKKLGRKFDRIIMPLPKSAEAYLKDAFKAAKKGAAIHLYQIMNEKELPFIREKLKKYCKKRNFRLLRVVKCGEYSPRTYRVCVDFRV